MSGSVGRGDLASGVWALGTLDTCRGLSICPFVHPHPFINSIDMVLGPG